MVKVEEKKRVSTIITVPRSDITITVTHSKRIGITDADQAEIIKHARGKPLHFSKRCSTTDAYVHNKYRRLLFVDKSETKGFVFPGERKDKKEESTKVKDKVLYVTGEGSVNNNYHNKKKH
jgi:hypothetical protein